MKFIRTVVALSFAVVALAAQLNQPQGKRADSVGNSLDDNAHVGDNDIGIGQEVDPESPVGIPNVEHPA
ncbi:hypothetical protein BJV78DRAFT_1281111 [Lactifluus subvellereus]|nr:hypothetical protein BJV78DRAFT_1281111 [Lactifluus subvellereus]